MTTETGPIEPSTRRGYVQIYTGDGKGKTTAALGLALRAVGAGYRVLFAKFVKGRPYSEDNLLRTLSPKLDLRIYGRDCFLDNDPEPEDRRLAGEGLAEVASIMASFDLVVLDEITIAIHFDLVSPQDLFNLLDKRPASTELVLTGRYAAKELIDQADLVTEMHEIDHYYRRGILARPGIDC